jgi:hypothetical protein
MEKFANEMKTTWSNVNLRPHNFELGALCPGCKKSILFRTFFDIVIFFVFYYELYLKTLEFFEVGTSK